MSAQAIRPIPDQVPAVPNFTGGQGVNAQRRNLPDVSDRRPHIAHKEGGQGVSAQRQRLQDARPQVIPKGASGRGVSRQRVDLPAGAPRDAIPHVNSGAGVAGGRGVNAQRRQLPSDKVPKNGKKLGGSGVSAQRRDLPEVTDQTPHLMKNPGGGGVSAQRITLPDKRPLVMRTGGGTGVSQQREGFRERVNLTDKRPLVYQHIGGPGVSPQRVTASRIDQLVHWFALLQERLAAVVVLNRGWESAVTPTLLMHTPTSPKPPVGIFLDPPYRTDTGRRVTLYDSDILGNSDDVAERAYAWAVEHGGIYRIAYACHEGDFPVPPGWDSLSRPFGGIRTPNRRAKQQDMIMFSPACLDPAADPRDAQLSLMREDA